MEESTYVDPKVIRLQDQLVFAKVNGRADTVLARQYGISGYPTIILLTSTGEEIDRLWGYFPPNDFEKKVTDYLAGKGTLPALEKQLAKEPENIDLLMQVGEKYASRSQFEKSIGLYEQVIAKDPENKSGKIPTALSGIGDVLYRGKKYMEAKERYQTIVEKYPTAEEYNDAVTSIPLMHELAGDTALAISLYQQVLKEHPNHPDTAWVQKRLAKLTAPPATK